ncbi:hypothetical protein ABZ705_25385 [Streptomyces sp. NPDC006984]|uniref:hypothetical protein n=1 Tax=Streptomyces sp. NPDC006984 TaxID=3155463 RepID=UPI0033F71E76
MPKGFVRWYQESAPASKLDKQVDFLRKHGIHLTHPALGTTLVLDIEGNGIPVERSELDRLLAIRIASINVNWWLSGNVNLVDEYSFSPLGFDIQTIWLDGLDAQETRLTEAALQEIALAPWLPPDPWSSTGMVSPTPNNGIQSPCTTAKKYPSFRIL